MFSVSSVAYILLMFEEEFLILTNTHSQTPKEDFFLAGRFMFVLSFYSENVLQ